MLAGEPHGDAAADGFPLASRPIYAAFVVKESLPNAQPSEPFHDREGER